MLVDLRTPASLPAATCLLFRLICFANGNDVHTVIVDGRIALEDRKAMFVDEEKILATAQREAELLIGRAGLASLIATPATVWS